MTIPGAHGHTWRVKNSTLSLSKSLSVGDAALKELTKTAVDIVVVDVEIPGINGVELVEKLRRSVLPVC
jgi:two-component SAPR family response regulator